MCDAEIEEENVTHVVELKKTIRMLSDKDLTHCQDCEPLFIDTPGSRGWCTCNLLSHFVKPWRCIPCVLAEEAQIVTSQQDYLMSYDPGQPRKWVYSKASYNLFEKPASANSRPLDPTLRLWESGG